MLLLYWRAANRMILHDMYRNRHCIAAPRINLMVVSSSVGFTVTASLRFHVVCTQFPRDSMIFSVLRLVDRLWIGPFTKGDNFEILNPMFPGCFFVQTSVDRDSIRSSHPKKKPTRTHSQCEISRPTSQQSASLFRRTRLFWGPRSLSAHFLSEKK
jgi:hypothetical protein